MEPRVGKIVLFNVDEYTQKQIVEAAGEGWGANTTPLLPAIIVKVWSGSCVNLKLFTDGKQDIWVTSVSQGTEPRTWQWPG
jgi:hypothetical protein